MPAFDPVRWAVELLSQMRLPVTRANVTAIVAWHRAEGGHTENAARWNPLNTTRDRPGDHAVNSVGVRAYRNEQSGLNATQLTLENGLYGGVLAALRHGHDAGRVARAVVASPWGTTSLVLGCLGPARATVAAGYEHAVRAHERDRGHHHHGGHSGHGGSGGHGGRPVGRGGHRVVLDPDELGRLADRVDLVEDVTRAVRDRARSLRHELALASAHAPDRARGARLDALLDDAARRLDALADALGVDEGTLRSTRKQALAADGGGRPVLSPTQLAALLDALDGTLPPGRLNALEALLAGGLRTHRHHRPHAPADGSHHSGGSPSPAGGGRPDRSSARDRAVHDVVRMAESQLGYHEAGTNLTKYGAWYGAQGQPWCGMFVSWVFAKSGHALPALQGSHGYASVNLGARALAARGRLRSHPMPGDLYLHRGPTTAQDHTGLVVKVEPDGDFWTIEGNYGDRVTRRLHRANEGSMYGFGRVL